MKKYQKFYHIIMAAYLLLHFGCTKEDESYKDENTLTEEISKIENSYEEGVTKYEGFVDEPKIETLASQEFIDKIKAEIEESFSKQISYVKSGENLVGVFKYWGCGSYLALDVNMDCEDKNPASSKGGFPGASYVTSPYKNVIFKFCVVDRAYFANAPSKYGILQLTADHVEGVSEIKRYFDNENSPNCNWIMYNNVTYQNYGQFGACYFGSDMLLSFYYYEYLDPNTSFPYLGISYGVLGTTGIDPEWGQGWIFTDDEDKYNANFYTIDSWTGSQRVARQYTSWEYNNIFQPGGNTKLFISIAREF